MANMPDNIRHYLRAAGWHPGRRVPISAAIPSNHPAAEVLAAFSGLTVEPDREAGEECAPAVLAFRELEPDESIIGVWGHLLYTRLVGVADVCHGHGELYVAADGRYFGSSQIHDAFYFEGESLVDCIERAMFGRRAQPLLRPDQSSVTLYGDLFTADSPGVYRYG